MAPPDDSRGVPPVGGRTPGDPPTQRPSERQDLRQRLDPDRAAAQAASRVPQLPPPVIDTRPFRWMIGMFGLALVVAISVYQFATNGVGTAGVPAGKPLHLFAAPLATSTLNGDANLTPPCMPARHDLRALNICLLVGKAPLVIGFFVTGSDDCKRQIDAMQAISGEFPPRVVQFAAVAVRTGHADAAAAVRSHHWTIPVAYDRDGAVGSVYGVEICPLVEIVNRGGIVAGRLIGDGWLKPAALAARVRALLRK